MLLQRLLLFIGTILTLSRAYTYIGSEESLRKNIADLLEGKLKFSDDNTTPYEGELSDTTPKNNSEYDFIVIGAGSAGCVIASRLSENKSYTVLLIEAGSKEYPIMDIPLLSAPLQFSEEINWNYHTEPSDRYCLGFMNRSCTWPMGKVMGGTSVLHFMLASRGNRKDYDGWANSTGDASWAYKNMLKYFKKLENFQVKEVPFDRFYHNKHGPVHISDLPYESKLAKIFMEGLEKEGYPKIDYNGREEIGISYFQTTTNRREKWSSNRAYLYPVKNRTNLFLTRDSHVDQILINNNTKAAYAVQFSKFSKNIVVKARKEIILSAGSISSPKILMLSGIGPAQHLHDLGIKVAKDAPVGENLMDHVAYGGLIFRVNDSETYKNIGLVDPKNPAVKNYINKRNGSLAMSMGYETLGFINVDDSNSLADEPPNIEYLYGTIGGLMDPIFSKLVHISDESRNIMLSQQFNHSSWSIWPVIMYPKSRGKLLLRSKNPNAKPKLYPNYLDHPDDVRVLIKGIRGVIKFSESNFVKKYGSELYEIPLKCGKYKFDSDEFWECAMRTYTMTTYHVSGTCKMGQEDDKTAVLNSQLQVKGIKNLRVVDASIIPNITSGHLYIQIVAIAEKISDIIKETWRKNN